MKRRNPILYIILSFVIPFFAIYWLYTLKEDIFKGFGIKSPSILLVLIPMLLAPTSAFDYGGAALVLSGVVVMAIIAMIVYFMYKLSSNAEKAFGAEINRNLILALLIILSPIGSYIIQEKLNNVIDSHPQQAPQAY